MASKNTSTNTSRHNRITYGSTTTRQRPSTNITASSKTPAKASISASIQANIVDGTQPGAEHMSQHTTTNHRKSSTTGAGATSDSEVIAEVKGVTKRRKLAHTASDAPTTTRREHNGSRTPYPQVSTELTAPEKTKDNTTQRSANSSSDFEAGLLPPVAIHSNTMLGTVASEQTGPPRPSSTSAQHPRRRLIDALAEQRADSDSESGTESSPGSIAIIDGAFRGTAEPRYASPSQPVRPVQVRTPDRRPLLSKSRKIKITYSQSRSFLGSGSQSNSDASIYENATRRISPAPENDVLPAPISPPPAANFDFEDEPSQERLGIQSVHELRRAGANNRFSDEMDDLVSRIGRPATTPSTMRRNALCELAIKLQGKDFSHQFRDHAARDKIVKNIGSETDAVSGFALAASLVIFLSSSPAPHLLRQMAAEEIGNLLRRLFEIQEDLEFLVASKSLNLSRTTKNSLMEVKAKLLRMNIWHDEKLSKLSPRTLALQLFYILCRDSDPHCLEDVSHGIQKDITSIALAYTADHSRADIDCILIILALEAQSNLIASESNRYASAISGFLHRTLHTWPAKRSSLDKAILKLAINTGNTESGASIFDDTSLLSKLASSVFSGISSVDAAVRDDTFEEDLYEELLLILGIVINILEHCVDARASMDGLSIDTLTSLWINTSSTVSEAESVGQSKLGVAVGYLAITVGYLYLAPSGRQQMRSHSKWPGTRLLVSSIQDFLGIIKAVDSKMHELDVLMSDLRKQEMAER